MVAGALLLMAADISVAGPCLHGGAAEGMCVASVPQTRGVSVVPLLPAKNSGPAIPAQLMSVVRRLLEAHDRGNGGLPPKLLADGATSRFCDNWSDQCFKSAPLTAWPVGAKFTHNQPYLLADGRIRVEWMRDGKLVYLSLIRFDGLQVVDIDTAPASIPMRPSGA